MFKSLKSRLEGNKEEEKVVRHVGRPRGGQERPDQDLPGRGPATPQVLGLKEMVQNVHL